MRTWLRMAIAGTAVAAGAPTGALELHFTHPYREFVDVRNVTASVSSRFDVPLDCAAGVAVAQAGTQVTLTLRAAAGAAMPGACGHATAMLAPLAAGVYEVTARVIAADGSLADAATRPLRILPLAGRCNAEPALSPSIMGQPQGATPGEFVARVSTDAAFAASLGHPAVRVAPYGDWVYFDYPPLDDIPPAMERLALAGALASLARNGYACFATSPPDAVAQVVEFSHAGRDHYFYSGDAGEIAAIDAGLVGPWTRTGKSFRAVTQPGCAFSTTDTVVYRFFGRPGSGPNSHFFTRDRAECYAVDQSAKWDFEGLSFWASAPNADGSCPAPPHAQQRIPLYRVWRPFGESNHRLTTDRAVVVEMVARGWVDEGIAMCVVPPT